MVDDMLCDERGDKTPQMGAPWGAG